MRNKTFTWALLLLIIAGIAFAFICFLGINFYTLGDTNKSIIFAILFAIVPCALALLAKVFKQASRNRRNNFIAECISLVLFVAAAIVAIIPFSHFFNVNLHKEQVKTTIDVTLSDAENMYPMYEKYTNNRIVLYAKELNLAVSQKNSGIDTTKYNFYGFVKGTSDQLQINKKINDLKDKILPSDYQQNKEEHCKWISNARKVLSKWNPISVVTTLNTVEPNITSWCNELIQLSTYRANNGNEQADDFKYSVSFNNVKDIFTIIRTPNVLGILIALCLYFIMLLPYLSTNRSAGWPGVMNLFSGSRDTGNVL